MIKAIMFDMDGLLVNSEPIHHKAWEFIFNQEGLELSEEDYPKFIGGSNESVAEYLIEHSETERSVEELCKVKKEKYLSLLNNITLMQGAKELLDNAKKENIKLLLTTSTKKDEALAVLGSAGLKDCFDDIVFGDEVEKVKPNPDIYLAAIKKSGFPTENCIAIEDSGAGVAAATSAGLKCIAVPTSLTKIQDFSKATIIIDSLKDINIEKINKLGEKNG
ncbi:MAG: HAD family phosphatase [bacterium]|nr:HAD family phosphatase [bacterium]